MNAIFNFISNLIRNPVQTVVRAATQFVNNPVGTVIGVIRDIASPQSRGSSATGGSSGSAGSSSRSSNWGDDADRRGTDEARRREAQRRAEEARKERLIEQFDRDIGNEYRPVLPETGKPKTSEMPDLDLLRLKYSDPMARKLINAYQTRPNLVSGVMNMAASVEQGANMMFAKWGWDESANGNLETFLTGLNEYFKSLLMQATDPYPTSYPDICNWLPEPLRGGCDGDLADFRNTLDLFIRFGQAFGLPTAAAGLFHYFDGKGEPAYLNPNQILESATSVGELSNVVSNQYLADLFPIVDTSGKVLRAGIDPITLFTGKALNEVAGLDNSMIVSRSQTNSWQSLVRFTDADLVNSIGTATVRPIGAFAVNYTFEASNNRIRMTITQGLEIYDRYDWNGQPIAVNPSNGLVRLYSTATTPPVEMDPTTNTITKVLQSDSEVVANGFISIPYPPDTPNQGGLEYLLGLRSADPGPVFGNPDHPNPINRELRRHNIQIDSDFYAGGFHRLEAEGSAVPYDVYSNINLTIEYEVPYSIDPNGSVQVSSDPSTWTVVSSLGEAN